MSHSVNLVLVSATLTLFAGAASAIEMPIPKVGMWETHIEYSSDGKKAKAPAVAQRCLDAAALTRGKLTGDEYIRKNCTKYETRKEGGSWIVDMECKDGANTMITHSVTAYAGDNAYHTELTLTYDPPASGARSRTVIDGKWMGACKSE